MTSNPERSGSPRSSSTTSGCVLTGTRREPFGHRQRSARRTRAPAGRSAAPAGLAPRRRRPAPGHRAPRRSDRQRDHHRQAAAGRVLGPDAGSLGLGQALGDGEAEADAVAPGTDTEALERSEHALLQVVRYAAPVVDDPHLHRVVGRHSPPGRPRRLPHAGARCATRLASTRSVSATSTRTAGRTSGIVRRHAAFLGRGTRRAGHPRRRRRGTSRIPPDSRRVMSSRSSTIAVSRSVPSSAVPSSSARSASAHSTPGVRSVDNATFRAAERRPEVVRHGGESAVADPVPELELAGSIDLPGQLGATPEEGQVAAKAVRTRRSASSGNRPADAERPAVGQREPGAVRDAPGGSSDAASNPRVSATTPSRRGTSSSTSAERFSRARLSASVERPAPGVPDARRGPRERSRRSPPRGRSGGSRRSRRSRSAAGAAEV